MRRRLRATATTKGGDPTAGFQAGHGGVWMWAPQPRSHDPYVILWSVRVSAFPVWIQYCIRLCTLHGDSKVPAARSGPPLATFTKAMFRTTWAEVQCICTFKTATLSPSFCLAPVVKNGPSGKMHSSHQLPRLVYRDLGTTSRKPPKGSHWCVLSTTRNRAASTDLRSKQTAGPHRASWLAPATDAGRVVCTCLPTPPWRRFRQLPESCCTVAACSMHYLFYNKIS